MHYRPNIVWSIEKTECNTKPKKKHLYASENPEHEENLEQRKHPKKET